MRPQFFVALAALVACSGGGGDGSPPGPDADVDPAPLFGTAASTITLTEMVPGDGGPASFARIRAEFADASLVFQAEVAREGNCRLLTWDEPLCDPACGDAACVEPGTCVPYPTRFGVGTLTVTGLVEPVSLDPDALDLYVHEGTDDLFAPDAAIAISASGDDLPAFTLAVAAPSVDRIRIGGAAGGFPDFQPGEGHTFRWSPVDPGSRVRLHMASDRFHGQPNAAVVECEGPDVGALAVPAAILDAFIDRDNWSCGRCPEQTLSRHRRATTDDGAVEILVGESYSFYYYGYRP